MLLAACSQATPTPPLALESFRPGNGQAILLNEPLSLTFTDRIDPATLSPANLRVLRPDGREAPGDWRLQGRWLRFFPRTVLSANLETGGYQPGGEHELIVRGFPSLGGVAARTGEPLDRSYRLVFQVAGAGEQAFLDYSPFECETLRFEAPRGRGRTPLRLTCAEPLDPRSLRSEDFRILRAVPGTPIFCGVQAVMVESRHAELIEQNQEGCVIELLPERPLDPDPRFGYLLEVASGATLADYAQHSPWPFLPQHYAFRIEPDREQQRNQVQLDFIDEQYLTSQPVPWAAGEATWQPGRLTVGWPAMAGSGRDGDVHPEGSWAARDTQAIELVLEPGATASIQGLQGPCILRAQGRLEVAGRLVRTASAVSDTQPGEWYRENPAGTADELLQFALQNQLPWTFLIAGGDLEVPGEISVDGPLILVSGGRLRLDGRVQTPPGEWYQIGRGGGRLEGPRPQVLELPCAAPRGNPLRRPLVFARLTSTLPAWVLDRYEWQAWTVQLAQGAGRAEVFFLPAAAELTAAALVGHPSLLPPDSPLRVLVQLTLEPGDVWDPPVVDSIDLSWKSE
ncbi:MAG: Ig-like domain-containing protein [Planctomycetota bacterium]